MPSIAARAESDLNLPLLEQQQQQQSRDAQVYSLTMKANCFNRLRCSSRSTYCASIVCATHVSQ